MQRSGLAAAGREPLAGDASTRLYERLHLPGGGRLIFMDQPPRAETPPCPPEATPEDRARLGFNALYRLAAGRIEAFAACAGYLRDLGLSAPEVVAADPGQGFAVLEDLGDDLFARVMAEGADEAPLYDTAVDVLARLHQAQPPGVLCGYGLSWPLLTYDELALKTAGDLFMDWQPQFNSRFVFGDRAKAEWEAVFAPVRARGAALASVFCHRDFHAENLIWLPQRAGAARCGLIDFQDAVRAHPAWDLSMLLHDARRDVSPAREEAVLGRYFDARGMVEREAFLADFHGLGALNVVRILGIFARLVVRDGKPRYAAFMPRLWRYLDRCAEAPGPAGLAEWLARHAPPEARAP
ncbi:MAG TPA: phosphotransferase [Caulobacteraceae bacterium]|nr:phosphotransferase [Caulobacteraceae bacterium]